MTVVTVDISTAQILALGSVSPVVVAAPGNGFANIMLYCFIQFNAGSHPFGAPTGPESFGVTYDGGTIAGELMGAGNSSLGNQEQFFHSAISSPEPNSVSLPVSDIENRALVVKGPDVSAGPITSSTLGSAHGLGYAPGDTGFLSNFSGDATYVVDTVGAGGAATSYHLDNDGTAYRVVNGTPTQVSTGGGDGNFTINITSIQQGNGSAIVTVAYQTLQLPV